MKIKSALHVHIKGDPLDKIPYDFKELIDHAHKLNFKVIAITCHNYIFPISKLKKYAEKKEILIIPGTEIEIQNRHVIALNPSQEILKIKSFTALRKHKLLHKNLFLIAPHPYFPALNCLQKKLEKNIDLFDAIEFNYFYTKTFNFNKKALRIAQKYNKPVLGTSDCHTLKTLNSTYSEIEIPDNQKLTEKNFFQSIKSNRIQIITQPLSVFKCASILIEMLKM